MGAPPRIADGTPATGRQARVAEDLGALLERLGIPARICDGKGSLLFSTADADAVLARRGIIALQALKVSLEGAALCITTVGGRSDLIDVTPRQMDVIRLIAEGLSNREIAERMQLSLHTVRRHVEGLLQRLQVRSRRDAELLLRHFVQLSARTDGGPLRLA